MVSRHYYFKTKNDALSYMIYLKDFKSSNLKITKMNCADRFAYFIDYLKNNNTKPLYLKMLDFYGYIEIYRYIDCLLKFDMVAISCKLATE